MSEKLPTIDEILGPLHTRSCHSQQAWFKGQTEPFPCDCYVAEARAHFEKLIAAERLEGQIKELDHLPFRAIVKYQKDNGRTISVVDRIIELEQELKLIKEQS